MSKAIFKCTDTGTVYGTSEDMVSHFNNTTNDVITLAEQDALNDMFEERGLIERIGE